MEENNKHIWSDTGKWDGYDPETKLATGGILYVCSCGKKVNNPEAVIEHGGTIHNMPVDEYFKRQEEIDNKILEELK